MGDSGKEEAGRWAHARPDREALVEGGSDGIGVRKSGSLSPIPRRAGDQERPRRRHDSESPSRKSKKKSKKKKKSRRRRSSSSSSPESSDESSSEEEDSSASDATDSSDDDRRRKKKKKSKKTKDKKKKGKSTKRSKESRKSEAVEASFDDTRKLSRAEMLERQYGQGRDSRFSRFSGASQLLRPKDAALRLQRVTRGHFVRRWTTKVIRKIRAQRKALTWELSEMIIREVLERDIVPDLLVEIVTSMSPEAFAPYPSWLKEQLQIAESVIGEVIGEEADAIVRESSRELIKVYLAQEVLARKNMKKGDELALYTELEVVEPEAESMMTDLAREVVREMAQEHLLQQWLNSVVEELVTDTIYEASAMAYLESWQEATTEKLCNTVIEEMCLEIGRDVYNYVVGEERSRMEQVAKSELSQLSIKLLESATLRLLGDRIATRGESVALQEYGERIADRLMHSLILRHAITSQRAVEGFRENLAYRYVLHQVMSRLLVQQLVEQMTWLNGAIDEEEGDA